MDASIDEATIREWWTRWPYANIGIACESSGLVVLDIDPRNGGKPDFCPKSHVEVRTGGGGWHRYFRVPSDGVVEKPGRGIDVKYRGYVVAPPSRHPETGQSYSWITPHLAGHEQVDGTWALDLPALPATPIAAPASTPSTNGTHDVKKARRALAHLAPSRADDREQWVQVGMALQAVSDALLPDWEEWSRFSLKFAEGECEKLWRGFREKPHGLTIGSLVAWAQEDNSPRLRLTSFADITEEKVRWLWPAVVPYGKLTLFCGHPGEAKSLASVDLAARLSSAGTLPDGTTVEAADVLLVFCEDDAADTVKPRLRAADAAMDRVHSAQMIAPNGTERMLNLADDLAMLGTEIKRTGARLVVLDPISAYLGGKTNSWKDDEVRNLLEPVAQVAERTECAFIGIIHLNKTTSGQAVTRITGSMGFVGVARSVFMFGPHPEDTELELHAQRKIFAPVKMNLTKAPRSRVFRVVETDDQVPRISWEDETRHSAADMLNAQITGVSTDGKIEQAVLLLKDLLSDGPRQASEIYEAAEQRGISKNTLKRAKKIADVISTQEMSDGKQHWTWRLPDDGPTPF